MKCVIYTLSAVFLILLPLSEATPLAGSKIDYIENLAFGKDGSKVTFTWDIKTPVPDGKIYVLRGKQLIDILPGDVETYEKREYKFGIALYTFVMAEQYTVLDHDGVIVCFGKLSWDSPDDPTVHGFYIYIAEATSGKDPHELLPYDDPGSFDYDVGYTNDIPLVVLYNNYLLDKGMSYYYIALSSYSNKTNNNLISPLTEPILFKFIVMTKSFWDDE